jgi:hypothetical protein
MRRPFRATVIAPILAGILAVSAVAVAGTWSIGDFGRDLGRESGGAGAAPKSLHMRGHVTGLYPGHAATLRVRIRNPLPVRVGVYVVRVHVHRGNGPIGRCAARMITIRPWKGMRRIPAGWHRDLRIKVRMRPRAPDRCVGARWRFTYDARSVRM